LIIDWNVNAFPKCHSLATDSGSSVNVTVVDLLRSPFCSGCWTSHTKAGKWT